MALSTPGISIRDAMVPVDGARNFFDAVRDLGVEAVELEVKLDHTCPAVRIDGRTGSISNDAAVRSLRKIFAAEGIRISALLLATDFSAAQADQHLQWATGAVRAAGELGVPVVRIDPLTADRALPSDTVRERFTRRTSELLEATADSGVDLGIENHGPIANDPAFLDAVFAALPNPRLGLTLDTGNFYWFGFALGELYELIDRYAPRARHTHLKNINYPAELAGRHRAMGIDYGKYCCALDEGNIDLRRVIQSLQKGGYTRDLCIENESLGKHPRENHFEILRRDVNAVARAMRS